MSAVFIFEWDLTDKRKGNVINQCTFYNYDCSINNP